MLSIINREKYLWTGASIFIVIVLALFLLSPLTFAQSAGSNDPAVYSEILLQVMRFIQNYYIDDVDLTQLYEGAMRGMFESLGDPHSVFLTATDMGDLTTTTTGRFGGVGLYISKQPPSTARDERRLPYVRVVAPIEGTPAHRLGISAGDYITKIDDKPTDDMTMSEVLSHLRGEPGTMVNVTILRDGNIVFSVDIRREFIVVPTVRSAMIDSNTAYLRIIKFTPVTPVDVRAALETFAKNGYSSLIIDLRGNPGGLLSSVTDVADFFLSDEVIVSTRSRIPRENQTFRARRSTLVPRDIPIVVLIDRGSASASEILAGALRDNNRAFLVGEQTFGKGSVQQVRSIGDSGFRLTMSRYYTPAGTSIDRIGITPDKEMREEPLSQEELESHRRIIEGFVIQEFVRSKPNPTERDISNFLTQLRDDGNVLQDRVIRRLIRNELNRTNNDPPVFDLEFDVVLQAAVDIIRNKAVVKQ
ncbi:MAG: S41 family peptidase [Spirochaetes bacterium]|nr:S41 family peptidase [Spirochaetota bacterium]